LVIRRKIWLLALIFLLAVGITAFATFRQSPVWEAVCMIRYKQGVSSALASPGSPYYWLSPYYDSMTFETEKHIIKSKAVAEGVVEKLQLARRDRTDDWESWTRRVQGALSVEKEPDTRIYLLRARFSDPDLTRKIVNTAAEVYIDLSVGEKRASAQKSLSLLTSQIGDLKAQIAKSQMALIDYINKEGAPETAPALQASGPSDSTGRETTLLSGLYTQLVQLNIQRGELLIKYLENHPKVKEADQQIEVLRTTIAGEEERLNRARKKAIEYDIRQKESSVNQELYNVLLKKLAELDLSKEGIESDIAVIEKADLPRAPVAPQKKRNLMLGALLGFLLGLAAIFVTEYVDPTLQTPEEAESYLDLPVLASIPRMLTGPEMNKADANQQLFLISERSPRSHETEMFKRLRTGIRFSDFEATTMALLITSSSPQEGKTTVATNLGITLAHAGSKTVLVDTDMRRPAMDRIFNLSATPGISAYLQGKASPEKIIYPTDIPNLSIIPAGEVPNNPAELLESPRLPALIETLKKNF
ncbi:MAG: polysaccharide biosynthesis tyrosine autokinase, partial [Candidatus Aureabacteria bacterium]|nr:polysaccharide biosynthesis tyrosine autokinase [Candidatus Auribacterota bacterium]